MLVLAIDTSTPAVTAGVVLLSASDESSLSVSDKLSLSVSGEVETLAVRVTVNPRAHAEVLTPHVLECLAEASITPADLGAVVVGVGPGPYTGLRVGMATGAAFGDALGIPVYGVCSLDAIAAAVETAENLLVVTDARRREIYWARYDKGVRVEGPDVNSPGDVEASPSTRIAGSASHVDLFDLRVVPAETPSPAGLVKAAAVEILAGSIPEPLEPLYLRRPDAKTLAERGL
ncbi:tRNA (adenosine(37)-N6)-threonylcarbamoyltransferase complex dimerization subunit type 1 TsaB [Rhodococcus sp. SRB_17]|nr:tRNA (adenosine(37)-N6)-threonylcarbamoyltransferase complex dimerization subunit type 1 TsaB [Rhodococcus sp. SRB_17]